MPFVSESQRRLMYSQHPEIARRWEKHTPEGKLPERVKRAFVEELEKIAQTRMEKRAILGSLALGAGIHAGMNLGYKEFRSRPAGRNFEVGSVATGYRHALAGRTMNPIIRNVATFGVGPESLEGYALGSQLGAQLKGTTPHTQKKFLKKLRKNVAMTEHVRNAPIGRTVVPAINRIFSGQQGIVDRIPHVAASEPTLGRHILSAGMGAAAVAAAPHTGIHFGITGLRHAIAHSRHGQKFLKTQLKKGLAHPSLQEGQLGMLSLRHPETKKLFDIAVSPAALDTRRFGEALAAEARTNPKGAAKIYSSLTGSAMRIPSIRGAVSAQVDRLGGSGTAFRIREALKRFRRK